MTGRKRPRPAAPAPAPAPARVRPRPRAVENVESVKAAVPERKPRNTPISGMRDTNLIGTEYDPWEAGATRSADFIACGPGRITGYYLPTQKGRAAYKLTKDGGMKFVGFFSTFQEAYHAVV